MSFIARGAIGQQAGAGIVFRPKAPGFPGPKPPPGFPVDEFPATPGAPASGPVWVDPFKTNLLLLLTLMNVLAARYVDNKKEDDKEKCKIYPFSDAKKECPDGRSHHIVPDRSWRSPGTRRDSTGKISISAVVDAMLDKFLPDRGGGYYYAGKMDEKKGQCICLTVEQHLATHKIFDDLEETIGIHANPQWTASLDTIEKIGAKSVSLITKCNEAKIKNDLRAAHEKMGLTKEKPLRADPKGKSGLTMEKFGEVLYKISQEIPPQ